MVKEFQKKNMNRNKTKYIVAIIISLIIGASILGYGYINYKSKSMILEKEEKIRNTRESELQNCLDDVQIETRKILDAVLGKDLSNISKISNNDIQSILDSAQKEEDECYKRYPVK